MAITEKDIIKGEYGSIYLLVWDGWRAFLTLRSGGIGSLTSLHNPRDVRQVRFQLLADPQDTIEGMTGPGYLGAGSGLKHRIVFWVDFDRTLENPQDDQRFDGYFFTRTQDAMAGITWWNGTPFGFYAQYQTDVIG